VTTLTEKRSSGDTIPALWSLERADDLPAGISMIGFDLLAVRDACIIHGWRFEWMRRRVAS
jgi:hypothetical protein